MDKKRILAITIFIIIFTILILSSNLYYNGKFQVHFESGTEDIILTKYVKRNKKIEKPIDPIKEGYVFIEWQLDGKTYNFNEEINEDITLTAKWMKEEYIEIIFNTNSDNVIENKKILKGSSINDLPVLTKEGYEFIGWYLNDYIYSGEEIHSDVTLTAIYKEKIIEPIFEIGDKVIIIGNYSNSAYSNKAYNINYLSFPAYCFFIICLI